MRSQSIEARSIPPKIMESSKICFPTQIKGLHHVIISAHDINPYFDLNFQITHEGMLLLSLLDHYCYRIMLHH